MPVLTSDKPTLAEIDEALHAATTTLRRLQLHGTLSQVAAAKDYLDRLLDMRGR